MKLTKQKLEQLILEQYKSMSRRIFDKRRQQTQGPGRARVVGNPDQPTNYPEYADKLSTLASSGPEGYKQAKELADTLDEPIDVEVDTSNPETIKFPQDVPLGYHDADGPYFTHIRYVMWANSNGYPKLTFTSEIVPKAVRAFANRFGLDYEKTLSDVEFNLTRTKNSQIRTGLNKFFPEQQLALVHGLDRDPFGYDPFEED